MIATSDDSGQAEYTFEAMRNGPAFELTPAQPSLTFSVILTATGLAPNGRPTTEQANVTISGSLRADDAPAPIDDAGTSIEGGTPGDGARWVRVWLEDLSSSGDANDGQSALTEFRVPRTLRFTGNCSAASDPFNPCQSVLRVHFDREDGGGLGGSVRGSWSMVFSSQAPKDDGPDMSVLPVPWQIEVVPQ
jgi:hypothetical protein